MADDESIRRESPSMETLVERTAQIVHPWVRSERQHEISDKRCGVQACAARGTLRAFAGKVGVECPRGIARSFDHLKGQHLQIIWVMLTRQLDLQGCGKMCELAKKLI